VVNNIFGSEYGRALGAIVNVVTKSGTNDWHGSIYDYFQNSVLNSRSLLQPEGQSKALRQNQFGATIGGPLRRDKTFIFANYEGQRRGEAPVLPPGFLNNFDAINRAKAYLGIPPENLGVLKIKNNDYGFIRFDHQLTGKHRLSVRYNIEDARDPNQLVGNTEDGGGIGTPSGGRDLFINDQAVVGTLNSLLKPNVVNTLLVQFARRQYNFPGATGEPNLTFRTICRWDTPARLESTRNDSNPDSLGWVKGNHYAKFDTIRTTSGIQRSIPGLRPRGSFCRAPTA
jgi:hypothetical protein